MAKDVGFACSECNLVLDEEEDQCNRCPSAPVSLDWMGYVIVFDPDRADVAKKLEIDRPGTYALKVNVR